MACGFPAAFARRARRLTAATLARALTPERGFRLAVASELTLSAGTRSARAASKLVLRCPAGITAAGIRSLEGQRTGKRRRGRRAPGGRKDRPVAR